MKITAQQFISNTNDKGTFAGVFKYFSENSENKTNKEGDLYCLMLISGSNSLPAERVSKFVWDGILDGYMYSTGKSTNESLKDAITEGVRKLKNLMKNDKSLEELGVNVNFVLVAQKKEGLYIGNLGENDTFVFKDGKFVNISEILGKSKASTAGIALGKEDILIVSTTGLVSPSFTNESTIKTPQEVFDNLRVLGRHLKGTNALISFAYEQEILREEKPNISTPNKSEVSVPKPSIPKIKIPTIDTSKLKVPNVNIKLPKFDIKNAKIKNYLIKTKQILINIGGEIAKLFKIIIHKCRILLAKEWEKLNESYGKKKWFKKVASRVSEVRINRPNYSPKGMRIDGYRTRDLRTKRIKLVVSVILIVVLLALGINFTIKAKKSSEVHGEAVKVFADAETLVKKAENSSTSDSTTTETAIYQAENKLKELPTGLSDKDIKTKTDLEGRILAVEDFLYKRVGLVDNDGKISTFIDSRLAFGEGSQPTDIEIYTDKSGNQYLVVTDKGLGAVYRVALYDKTIQKVADTNNLIKSPMHASIGNSGIFVYDSKEGILKAPFDKSGNVTTFETLSGLSNSDIKATNVSEFIVMTASDNVYLLSNGDKSLMKSVFSYDNKYGLLYKYLTNDDFSNATDVLADLSVYVLTNSNRVTRYSYSYVEQMQKENPLSISGIGDDLQKFTKGYTRTSLDYGLYVFDAQGSRFMKFEKPQESTTNSLHPNELVLKKQYLYRGSKTGVWSDVKDFVVDSSENTMYVLDGSVIWKVVL